MKDYIEVHLNDVDLGILVRKKDISMVMPDLTGGAAIYILGIKDSIHCQESYKQVKAMLTSGKGGEIKAMMWPAGVEEEIVEDE